jgi:3-oxoacyl-[acyl-carrier protein] reductase
MGKMTGKTTIVTGAAVGIGREIAVAIGREAGQVVVNYSKSRKEAEATAALVEEAGGKALLVQANVARDEQAKSLIQQTLDWTGRVDVLINNAGITARVPFENLDALTDEVWSRLYDVNVKGTFFCCRAAVEPMRKQGVGRIINLGSVAGIRPTGSSIAYCASKAALIHMSQCLAKTLGPEIRVNVIAPGFIDDTRWNEGVPNLDTIRQGAAATTPLKRVGLPADIAETALYLASGAEYTTGAVIVVDGARQLV